MSVDPITCHILDTYRGKPATGVVCQIYHLSPLIEHPDDESAYDLTVSKPFAMNKTDQDGRIKNWVLDPNLDSQQKQVLGVSGSAAQWSDLKPGIYKVKFLTDITFQVKNPPDAHYHIPLLLSNHSYTTYRGS